MSEKTTLEKESKCPLGFSSFFGKKPEIVEKHIAE
jgi:hypothetical protein